jgi:hypothetical protein
VVSQLCAIVHLAGVHSLTSVTPSIMTQHERARPCSAEQCSKCIPSNRSARCSFRCRIVAALERMHVLSIKYVSTFYSYIAVKCADTLLSPHPLRVVANTRTCDLLLPRLSCVRSNCCYIVCRHITEGNVLSQTGLRMGWILQAEVTPQTHNCYRGLR